MDGPERSLEHPASAEADASNFWSASSYVSNPAYAWLVSFADGYAYADYKAGAHAVRLVRGGQSFAAFDAFPPGFTLTVTAPTGGSVASSPAGIDCGATCAASFAANTSVTLTATAASGYSFGSWTGCDSSSGNSCTVSMSANKTVSASFVQTYTLTLAKTDPAGLGTVTSAPPAPSPPGAAVAAAARPPVP